MASTKTEATVEDLYNAPDEPGTYELVDGKLVHMPPTGDEPNFAASEIFVALREYVKRTGRGRARTDGAAYIVDLPNRKSFSPDASYSIQYTPRSMRFVDGAPLFAVEVRSEHDYGPAQNREYARKRQDYFAAGTEVVWDVDPLAHTIRSYHRDRPNEPLLFRRGEIAHAELALPGWRVAVDDLFSD
jgi:Uma2 family endonuclease